MSHIQESALKRRADSFTSDTLVNHVLKKPKLQCHDTGGNINCKVVEIITYIETPNTKVYKKSKSLKTDESKLKSLKKNTTQETVDVQKIGETEASTKVNRKLNETKQRDALEDASIHDKVNQNSEIQCKADKKKSQSKKKKNEETMDNTQTEMHIKEEPTHTDPEASKRKRKSETVSKAGKKNKEPAGDKQAKIRKKSKKENKSETKPVHNEDVLEDASMHDKVNQNSEIQSNADKKKSWPKKKKNKKETVDSTQIQIHIKQEPTHTDSDTGENKCKSETVFKAGKKSKQPTGDKQTKSRKKSKEENKCETKTVQVEVILEYASIQDKINQNSEIQCKADKKKSQPKKKNNKKETVDNTQIEMHIKQEPTDTDPETSEHKRKSETVFKAVKKSKEPAGDKSTNSCKKSKEENKCETKSAQVEDVLEDACIQNEINKNSEIQCQADKKKSRPKKNKNKKETVDNTQIEMHIKQEPTHTDPDTSEHKRKSEIVFKAGKKSKEPAGDKSTKSRKKSKEETEESISIKDEKDADDEKINIPIKEEPIVIDPKSLIDYVEEIEEDRNYYFESIRTDLRFTVFDEISLEGLDGITIEAFWKRVCVRTNTTTPFPATMEKYVWRLICASKEIEFFKLQEPRSKLVIYNRFENFDPDLGIVMDPELAPEDIYPFKCVSDHKKAIRGSCSTYNTRKNVTEIVRKMNIKKAVEK